ncbi:MAG TPA: serine hydrolase [Steroidobacteraceae bacterium]|nr:serine hydrolase [Steroidobacteraceae bacterium]
MNYTRRRLAASVPCIFGLVSSRHVLALGQPAPDLAQLDAAVRRQARISTFILYQADQIRLEYYGKGRSFERPINIKSASKSVVNALTGIALQRGDIKSLDTRISTFLPQYFSAFATTDARREITIRHLVSMSSGLPSTSIYNYGAWVSSRDWVAYALNQKLVNSPGEQMTYSTGDTHLLAAVLTKAAGTSLRAYAQKHLFDPLGVEIGGWDRDPQGNYFGGNNLALSPKALLAFGRLYLDGGMFDGKRVLTQDWIKESWTPRFFNSSYNARHDSGYLWWHTKFAARSTWFAWGYGGQFVFVVPELDAVAVFTGNPDATGRGGNNDIYALMDEVIVPYLSQRTRMS